MHRKRELQQKLGKRKGNGESSLKYLKGKQTNKKNPVKLGTYREKIFKNEEENGSIL